MELKGKKAVITGASGRLGGAIAKVLAEAGCACICHYNKNKKRAEELVEQIKEMGREAVAVSSDLRRPEGIDKLFECAEGMGTVEILINSAAVFYRKALKDITFEECREVLDLNLTAPILLSRIFAEKVKSKSCGFEAILGKIVNITDTGGIWPWAEYAVYCSSKAGLIGATKSLAKELAPEICVNAVAIGIANWPEEFDESERKRQLSFIPAGRIAEPREITEAIIFLLQNDYITGQVLNVDGGRCI